MLCGYEVYTGKSTGIPSLGSWQLDSGATLHANSIMPRYLLVTSDRPGYVMAKNDPKDGTVVGKSFDFCDEDYCTGVCGAELSYFASNRLLESTNPQSL